MSAIGSDSIYDSVKPLIQSSSLVPPGEEDEVSRFVTEFFSNPPKDEVQRVSFPQSEAKLRILTENGGDGRSVTLFPTRRNSLVQKRGLRIERRGGEFFQGYVSVRKPQFSSGEERGALINDFFLGGERLLFLQQKGIEGVVPIISAIALTSLGKEKAYLILPWCAGGNLIEAHPSLSPSCKRDVMQGVLRTLLSFHQHGYAYRDLKPENILLDLSEDGRIMPFFGDVACVTELFSEHRRGETLPGSPDFVPPDIAHLVLNQGELDDESYAPFLEKGNRLWDSWSFGVLLALLFRSELLEGFKWERVERASRSDEDGMEILCDILQQRASWYNERQERGVKGTGMVEKEGASALDRLIISLVTANPGKRAPIDETLLKSFNLIPPRDFGIEEDSVLEGRSPRDECPPPLPEQVHDLSGGGLSGAQDSVIDEGLVPPVVPFPEGHFPAGLPQFNGPPPSPVKEEEAGKSI